MASSGDNSGPSPDSSGSMKINGLRARFKTAPSAEVTGWGGEKKQKKKKEPCELR